MNEGYKVLESLGYDIVPKNEARFIRSKRHIFYCILKIVTATPIGKLAISDHAMSATEEIMSLSDAFDKLKENTSILTPNWDALKSISK